MGEPHAATVCYALGLRKVERRGAGCARILDLELRKLTANLKRRARQQPGHQHVFWLKSTMASHLGDVSCATLSSAPQLPHFDGALMSTK
jgi:hypothetical protein